MQRAENVLFDEVTRDAGNTFGGEVVEVSEKGTYAINIKTRQIGNKGTDTAHHR